MRHLTKSTLVAAGALALGCRQSGLKSPVTAKASAGTSRAKPTSTSRNMACAFTLTIGSGARRSTASGVNTRVADTGRAASGSASTSKKEGRSSRGGFLVQHQN